MDIRQAAKLSGLTADTIRFYERRGILPAPSRLPNRYRHYTEEHVATLRLANALRTLGLPLREIAWIVAIAHDGSCGDDRDRTVHRLSEVLTDLTHQLRELSTVHGRLATIRTGVARMGPTEVSVPGIEPCQCIQMVTAPSGSRSNARSGSLAESSPGPSDRRT